MATPMREGLRVRLLKPSVHKPAKKSNAERCKEYRDQLHCDPLKLEEYRSKYQERNRKNRRKTLTDEQLQRRREQDRLRQQKYRDKRKGIKLAKTAEPASTEVTSTVTTRQQQLQEKTVIDKRREQWRKYKQDERQRWSSQKKRRNRERSLAWYHNNKKSALNLQSESNPAQETPRTGGLSASACDSQPPTPTTSTPANVCETPRGDEGNREAASARQPKSNKCERKALYRAKQTISKLKPNALNKLMAFLLKNKSGASKIKNVDPSTSAHVKENVLGEIEKLKPKRSKTSLAAKRLLLDAVEGQSSPRGTGKNKYIRSKPSPSVSMLKEFLEDVSVDLPGKKTVDRKTLTQKKILPRAVKHLEKEFSKKHPDHKVSRATFYRHIPKHILTSSNFKHHSCLCEICVAIDNKLDVLNKHLNTSFEGRDSLSELTLCLDVTLDCLQRTCRDCGVGQVEDMIFNHLNKDRNHLVKWINWEIPIDSNIKRHKKGPEPVEKETTIEEMISRLLTELKHFSMHLFVFRWQYTQFKLCKATIPTRETLGLVVMDFSENFTCRPQNEVQSAYYGYTQITVHPCVLYYACPQSGCSEVVIEYLIFFSDDLKHDASMAQTILNRTVDHMQLRRPELKQLAVFSDGCAAQYKSKLPFHFLSDMKTQVQIDRAYFGSRHGKGPCDACGGVIKKVVERDILSGQAYIKDGETMYQHCTNMHIIPQNEPPAATCCHTRRIFFHLKEEDIDRSVKSSELMTIPGTRKMHCLRRVRKDVVQTRNLACFCTACLDRDETMSCTNKEYVKPWETFKIKHAVPMSSSDDSIDNSSLSYDDDSDVTTPDVETQKGPSATESTAMSSLWNRDLLNDAFLEVPNDSFKGMNLLPSRETFFRRVQEQFSACESYTELCEVVSNVSESFKQYPIPPIHPKYLYDVGNVDSASLYHIPSGLNHVYPVSTIADGNCVPRSFSLLIFGDQDHHIEIRCRVVHELVSNADEYLALEKSELDFLCKLSDFYCLDTKKVFQLETLDVSKLSVFMGMWQIMAAANVFQASVLSIYPPTSEDLHCYKCFYDRTVVPRNMTSSQILIILWTSTRENNSSDFFVANHVVPLMPLTRVSEIVN